MITEYNTPNDSTTTVVVVPRANNFKRSWLRAPRSAARSPIERFTPQNVCDQPGNPGSSPACFTCVASCSADPADIDPVEQWLIDAGEIE